MQNWIYGKDTALLLFLWCRPAARFHLRCRIKSMSNLHFIHQQRRRLTHISQASHRLANQVNPASLNLSVWRPWNVESRSAASSSTAVRRKQRGEKCKIRSGTELRGKRQRLERAEGQRTARLLTSLECHCNYCIQCFVGVIYFWSSCDYKGYVQLKKRRRAKCFIVKFRKEMKGCG